jgi:hypothetical protein
MNPKAIPIAILTKDR